jgi:hypothetical protein
MIEDLLYRSPRRRPTTPTSPLPARRLHGLTGRRGGFALAFLFKSIAFLSELGAKIFTPAPYSFRIPTACANTCGFGNSPVIGCNDCDRLNRACMRSCCGRCWLADSSCSFSSRLQMLDKPITLGRAVHFEVFTGVCIKMATRKN